MVVVLDSGWNSNPLSPVSRKEGFNCGLASGFASFLLQHSIQFLHQSNEGVGFSPTTVIRGLGCAGCGLGLVSETPFPSLVSWASK